MGKFFKTVPGILISKGSKHIGKGVKSLPKSPKRSYVYTREGLRELGVGAQMAGLFPKPTSIGRPGIGSHIGKALGKYFGVL